MGDAQRPKICVVCGQDCSGRPRTKDRRGRYFCTPCYEKALRRARARAGAAAQPAAAVPAARTEAAPKPAAPRCPSCDGELPVGGKICVRCGINAETGRSIVTSRALDENRVYTNTESVLRLVSWIVPIGFSPVASEAMGGRRPWTAWTIALLTAVVSVWFWLSTDEQMNARKNLMLWAGDNPPSAQLIEEYFTWTDWGDADAMEREINRLYAERESDQGDIDYEQMILTAHERLSPREQVVGRFHGYQLLTHALLHGDIFHLAGNLVFLLIFGSRVNALIGNIATAALYPLLAVIAALAEKSTTGSHDPVPMLGASGAIMGLAGMYFVLFPVNRIHVAAWFRWWFYFRFRIWRIRGFWVVLAYVLFDAAYLVVGIESGTAHWAHLGGFIAGMAIALGLLLSRVLNAGGGDLLTAVLGRRAWALIGRPGVHERPGMHLPGG